MRIDEELYTIASANYGVDLKDPVFVAFDKFIHDSRFELMHTILNDDYAEIESVLYKYLNSKSMSRVLRSIMDLIMIFNGRKGFYAKNMVGHRPDPEDNLSVWMGMLAEELRNSGNGNAIDGIAIRGNGVVNGARIRAAIYHMLDILSYSNSICVEAPIYTAPSPYCILGRDIYDIVVWGNEEGVGYLNPSNNKYYVDVDITNLYKGESSKLTITILIGDSPLRTNQTAHYSFPDSYKLPYSLYEVKVKDFDTDIQLSYHIIREHAVPVTDDYIYEHYGPAGLFVKILSYTGTDTDVIIPNRFDHDTDIVETIGLDAFADSDVEKVIIPEGVAVIE